MALRMARNGQRAGSQFWGCSGDGIARCTPPSDGIRRTRPNVTATLNETNQARGGELRRPTRSPDPTARGDFFRDTLGYAYLGNWEEREDNRNVEEDLFSAWLKDARAHSDALINRVLFELEKAAGDTSKSLYDRNRAVYDSALRREGKADVGENNIRSG